MAVMAGDHVVSRPAVNDVAMLAAGKPEVGASHVFNLLDARGVISVTERQSYILRVRNLAKACGEAFLLTDAGGAVAKAA